MKKDFFNILIDRMSKNENIYFLTGDLGWPRTDELAEKYPDRFINCGASEQTMCDIAVGLAYDNKIPFTYTISPFYYRGFETIRTYINHERLNVKMIGAGRDEEYGEHDGFSHSATDIPVFFKGLYNIYKRFPESVEELNHTIDEMIAQAHPFYLGIHK